MNGKTSRRNERRVLIALIGILVCSATVSIVSVLMARGGAYSRFWMHLHYIAGWLAFATLLPVLFLRYRQKEDEAADAPDIDWVGWLAEGAGIVLRVALCILPVLGQCLLYAQSHRYDEGIIFTLRNIHTALAWVFVAALPLNILIRVWRHVRGRQQGDDELEEADAPAKRAYTDPAAPTPRWLGSAEPEALVDHFLHHPPADFKTFTCVTGMPGFWAPYDLLTTADDQTQALFGKLPGNKYLRRCLQWHTCFMGSTVSEYCLMPPQSPAALVQGMFKAWDRKSALLIVKDIPCNAPFLSEESNRLADQLVSACKARGFFMAEGMALAWVPIDFADENEYLSRLSSGRRRDIRRKLRSREHVQVDIYATGDPYLTQPAISVELYTQYLEVYGQSTVHFDLLHPTYFKAVLADASLNGRVFMYYWDDKLIGFNLCFIHDGMLVDKTIGFRYPMARDNNLYFISWMENLAYARREGLRCYIAGWTDPAVKAALGAKFTPTRHAVYVRNPLLRPILRGIAGHFEPDKQWLDASRNAQGA